MCTYHKLNPNLTQKTIAYLVGRLKHKEKVQAPLAIYYYKAITHS